MRRDEHRNRAIAALLEVAPSDAASIFKSPNRLKALRFVEAVYAKDAPTLCETFTLTDEFVNVLETIYRSHAELLQSIATPETDLNLLNDPEIPVGDLFESFPKEVADPSGSEPSFNVANSRLCVPQAGPGSRGGKAAAELHKSRGAKPIDWLYEGPEWATEPMRLTAAVRFRLADWP